MAEGAKIRYDHHRGQAPLLRPGFKLRTVLFILFDLAGFAVVNAYWYYLGAGRWHNFGLETYYRNLQTPLGATFFEPLSIFSHPWMICVTGLLLAVIIFTPIMIAVLYRMTVAAAFVLVVLIVGHAPVLAMALLAGCFLAARTNLRSDMPFVAAMLGLLPVTIYMIISGFALADSAAVLPLQKWLVAVPLLLAFVTAIIATSLILALAKITNFRPGVVLPVLAVLLAGPLTIFYSKIGPAELEYHLIVSRVAPGDAMFESVSVQTWTKQNNGEGLGRTPLRNRVRDIMFIRRMELTDACNHFLSRWTDSKRGAEIAWIKGQCQSMQLDESRLTGGLVAYSASYPLTGALSTWQKLLADYPNRNQAALAQWRCAQLTIRNGDIEKGEQLLAEAVEKLRKITEAPIEQTRQGKLGGIFSPPGELPKRSYYDGALFEAKKLLWLIRTNNVLDDDAAAKVLITWTRLNPYYSGYADELEKLVLEHEPTALGHNLLVACALTLDDPKERLRQLTHLADRRASLRDTDAAIEANWELGQLTLKVPRLIKENGAASPKEYFQQVVGAPPNPWTELAKKRLKWLESSRKTPQ